MDYTVVSGFRECGALRRSFEGLARATFGLDFESWYQNDFWGSQYRPYSMLAGGEVVSNVSASLIDCELMGSPRRYIQLGTVMTAPQYRKQGLCARLMRRILADFPDSDGFFLFGNDSARDFYPRFGFEPRPERRYRADIERGAPAARPVPLENPADWRNFLEEKHKRVDNGRLELFTDGLLMFYMTKYMRGCLYYIDLLDAYAVAELEERLLTLHALYSPAPVDLAEACAAFKDRADRVELAFVPRCTDGFCGYDYRADDCTFFTLGDRINRDMSQIESFPGLAHA